jgi:hypothetical protein
MEMDTTGYHNAMAAPACANNGFTARRRLAAGSHPFDVCAPITADFVKADRFLAPGNRLSISLTRASNDFLIMAPIGAERYRLRIMDLKLYFNRIQVVPQMVRKVLSLKEHHYWMHRTELKTFNIGNNMREYTCQIASGLALPKTISIAFVQTAAATGSMQLNPLNFRHYNIRRINLRVNGTSVPSDAFTPQFNQNLFAREYTNMFMQTGNYRIDRGNCISKEAFGGGYMLMPFNIGDPDLCNQFHNHMAKSGTVELEVNFGNQLPHPVTVLAHLTYNELVTTKGTREPFETRIY